MNDENYSHYFKEVVIVKAEISIRKAASWAATLEWILEPISAEKRVTYINKENGENLRELLEWLKKILEEVDKNVGESK